MKQRYRILLILMVLVLCNDTVSFANNNYDNGYKVRIGLKYASGAKNNYSVNIDQVQLKQNSVPIFSSNRTANRVELGFVTLNGSYSTEKEAEKASSTSFSCYYKDSYFSATQSNKNNLSIPVVLVKQNDSILFAFAPKQNITLSSPKNRFKIEKQEYRGELELISNNSSLTAINYIGLQDYLYGVLPKEIPPEWEMDALKAQAICSRNFTITNMGKFKKYGFDLDTTTTSQVYGGIAAEDQRTNRAVDDTNGELGYYNGEIASLFFHSESGGQTESSENTWGMTKPYLVGVNDSFSSNGSYATWTYTISKSKLEGILSRSGQSVGTIKQISIDERTENGRVKKLTIYGTSGNKSFTKESFRRLIGNTAIKSMYFDFADNTASPRTLSNDLDAIFADLSNLLNKKSSSPIFLPSGLIQVTSSDPIVIIGHGFGHGVGMSQFGANIMAKNGNNYQDIISYYFKGVIVK